MAAPSTAQPPLPAWFEAGGVRYSVPPPLPIRRRGKDQSTLPFLKRTIDRFRDTPDGGGWTYAQLLEMAATNRARFLRLVLPAIKDDLLKGEGGASRPGRSADETDPIIGARDQLYDMPLDLLRFRRALGKMKVVNADDRLVDFELNQNTHQPIKGCVPLMVYFNCPGRFMAAALKFCGEVLDTKPPGGLCSLNVLEQVALYFCTLKHCFPAFGDLVHIEEASQKKKERTKSASKIELPLEQVQLKTPHTLFWWLNFVLRHKEHPAVRSSINLPHLSGLLFAASFVVPATTPDTIEELLLGVETGCSEYDLLQPIYSVSVIQPSVAPQPVLAQAVAPVLAVAALASPSLQPSLQCLAASSPLASIAAVDPQAAPLNRKRKVDDHNSLPEEDSTPPRQVRKLDGPTSPSPLPDWPPPRDRQQEQRDHEAWAESVYQ